jgi:hypothetical protein
MATCSLKGSSRVAPRSTVPGPRFSGAAWAIPSPTTAKRAALFSRVVEREQHLAVTFQWLSSKITLSRWYQEAHFGTTRTARKPRGRWCALVPHTIKWPLVSPMALVPRWCALCGLASGVAPAWNNEPAARAGPLLAYLLDTSRVSVRWCIGRTLLQKGTPESTNAGPISRKKKASLHIPDLHQISEKSDFTPAESHVF